MITLPKQVLRRRRLRKAKASRNAGKAAAIETRAAVLKDISQRISLLKNRAKAFLETKPSKGFSASHEEKSRFARWVLTPGAEIVNFMAWSYLIEYATDSSLEILDVFANDSDASDTIKEIRDWMALADGNVGELLEFALAGILAANVNSLSITGKAAKFVWAADKGKLVKATLATGANLGKAYDSKKHGLKNIGVKISSVNGRVSALFSQLTEKTLGESTVLKGRLGSTLNMLLSRRSKIAYGVAAVVALGVYLYDYHFDQDQTDGGSDSNTLHGFLAEIGINDEPVIIDGQQVPIYDAIEQFIYLHGMIASDPVRGWYELRSERNSRARFGRLDIAVISTLLNKLNELCFVDHEEDVAAYAAVIQSLDALLDVGVIGRLSDTTFEYEGVLVHDEVGASNDKVSELDEDNSMLESIGDFLFNSKEASPSPTLATGASNSWVKKAYNDA
jgi:hypothetical protein